MNEHGFFKVMREGALLMQVPKWLSIAAIAIFSSPAMANDSNKNLLVSNNKTKVENLAPNFIQ